MRLPPFAGRVKFSSVYSFRVHHPAFVERLPAIYREVITLSELEDVPHAEIARRLAVSVSGVKSRVQRGREQLHKLLTDCCEIALDARGGVVDCVPRQATAPVDCCSPPPPAGIAKG